MNFSVIYAYIANSYWARGIPEITFKKAIDNSLCFGVYTDLNEQFGFGALSYPDTFVEKWIPDFYQR
jgi:hypothetical protein